MALGFLLLLGHFRGIGAPSSEPSVSTDEDPFKEVIPKVTSESEKPEESEKGFFSENFAFRRELMSEFGTTSQGNTASRQSVGFEMQKKFSSDTKTLAALDFQARLVQRNGFIGFQNDMQGMNLQGLSFEYHNAYADFYNVLDPLFGDREKSANIGRFNARVGRFYLPFGLNLQTDTHGTILQLSNERNFGFERDWYAGLWGNLNSDLP